MSDKLESAFRLEMARDGQSHLFAELVYIMYIPKKKMKNQIKSLGEKCTYLSMIIRITE